MRERNCGCLCWMREGCEGEKLWMFVLDERGV